MTSIDESADWLQSVARAREAVSVRLSNAYCVALADKDDRYFDLLSGDGVNFPDGAPVVWAMRWISRGGPGPGRVRGPSFFSESLARSEANAISAYFLGTTPSTLEALRRAVTEQHPDLVIAGSYAPPFAEIDEEFVQDCADRILESNADIVWIALGTPKQDFLSVQIARATGRPCVGVGAAFDFTAGVVPEAPVYLQRLGLEWIYRFAQEPGRLWRRYTFGNVRFVKAMLWPKKRPAPGASR